HSVTFPARRLPVVSCLSLHDALPIWSSAFARPGSSATPWPSAPASRRRSSATAAPASTAPATCFSKSDRVDAGAAVAEERLRERSEEHTSELQSRTDLGCRPLLDRTR